MARKRKGDPVHGWVNLDKPYGMGSTQAVGKLRRLLNAQKIGHAGTLDPLATGVLPIALGEATKTIPYAQDAEKTYSFTVTWGEQRSTDDREGEVVATSHIRPTEQSIVDILEKFTGEVTQIPPVFSAIKIDGQRAYDLARAGENPEMKPRIVHIETLELIGTRDDEADFLVTCGKGTYIRSLARDMAKALGTKGYVSRLRRERVGCFTAENAISLDILEKMDYVAARCEALLPLQTVLDDIPALALKADETARLRSGQVLTFSSRPDYQRLIDAGFGQIGIITALAVFENKPIALIEQEKAFVKPIRVFNL